MINNVAKENGSIVSDNILKLRALTEKLCESDNHSELLFQIKDIVDSDTTPDVDKTIYCYKSLWDKIKIILNKL